MRGLGAKSRTTAAAAVMLLVAACGGDDSSGLATLAGTATTAAAVDPAEIEPVSEPTAVTHADTEAAETTDAASSAESDPAAGTGADEATGTEPATPQDTSGQESAGSEGAADGASGSGGAADNGPDGAEDGASGSEDLTDEERLLAFAQCMRDNGVDFPDPVVEADGTVTFRLQEIGRDADLPAARGACEGLIEGLAFGPGQGGFDLVELQDTLLEFAQCMRDNGVDMGDPDLRDFFPGGDDDGQPGGPFGDIDFSDPDLTSAFQTCQQLVSLSTPRFGGND